MPYKDNNDIENNQNNNKFSNENLTEINQNEINKESVFSIKKLKDEIKKPELSTKEIGVSAASLLKSDLEGIPFLVEPYFLKIGIASLAGSSDVGKSTLLRQLGIDVATGAKDFLGFPINATHNRVIYVSTEDDENALTYLLKKYNKEKQITIDKFESLRFILDTENLLKKLEKYLISNPVDLIIIDAFTDLYNKNLNESNQVRNFLQQYYNLAKKHKCLILFLHHTGKRTEYEAPNKNNLLGSQAFEAKMRMVMVLRNDIINTDCRHLCIVKGNYLDAESKKSSHVIKLDENQIFTNTGIRVLLDKVGKKKLSKTKDKDKFFKASKLKKQGMSHEKIADVLGYSSKSSVTELFKRHEKK